MKKFTKKIAEFCYHISMPLFMIIGVIMVVVQLYCVVTGNGRLCIDIQKTLQPWASNAVGICLLASFIHSYVKDSK